MANTAAFALALIGGILTLLGGLATVALGAAASSLMAGIPGSGFFAGIGAIIGVWGIIVGLILIVGGWKMNKGNKTWATITLVFSILGLITVQGFIIGPILALIGSILGWKTKTK